MYVALCIITVTVENTYLTVYLSHSGVYIHVPVLYIYWIIFEAQTLLKFCLLLFDNEVLTPTFATIKMKAPRVLMPRWRCRAT